MQGEEYFVINRKGEKLPLDFNKILVRLTNLKEIEPKLNVNIGLIAQNTIKLMVDGITTLELDNISANYCAASATNHYDYGQMASRIEVNNLHKITYDNYLDTINEIINYEINGVKVNILDKKLIKFVNNYIIDINKQFTYDNDYKFTYFGIKTLIKAYLIKKQLPNGNIKILERPQQMFMRVSIGINLNKITEDGYTDLTTLNDIFDTYYLMSNNYYTHATPTLFNAGTKRQSLSSCFLLSVDDNLNSIYKTLADTARISKWSGGIGIHVSQVRAKDSIIRSTNGKSEGIVPMLKVYNDSALYVSQGGGKRKGSTAVYVEIWHSDIDSFLDLKKPIGDEMLRARDLFLALWVCDIFMERLEYSIKNNKTVMWSLFCPDTAKGLTDVYGQKFNNLYIKYENEKKYTKQVIITELWKHILEIQMEAGMPYICYKDSVNKKSNQNNLGTIKSSNLCVHGDTMIMTDNGYYPIKTLKDMKVNVWNGTEFSEVNIRQTGQNEKLLSINFSDGVTINCTYSHKFYVKNKNNEMVMVEAQNLTKNDKIIDFVLPVIDGKEQTRYPYTQGYYDGINGNKKVIKSMDNKKILNHMIEYKSYRDDKLHNRYYTLKDEINNGFKVPINSSLKDKLLWLAGFIDACGFVRNNNQYTSLQFLYKDYSKFLKIKLLSNTLSLQPKITYYNKSDSYSLIFNPTDTYKLFNELKVPTQILKPIIKKYPNSYNMHIKVQYIHKLSNTYDTYCFNEPKKHMGIFNGIITGQCVHADTLILTDRGFEKISKLEGKEVNIWDTEQFIKAPVFKTGENQKLLKITTDDGNELKCTYYHRFKIKSNKKDNDDFIKRAYELKVNDTLPKFIYPYIRGNRYKNFKHPYTHGYFCGNGNIDKYNNKLIVLQKNDEFIDKKFNYIDKVSENDKITYYLNNEELNIKFFVPIKTDSKNRIDWMAGFLDANGLLSKDKKSNCQQIITYSINKKFLYNVKLLCNTLGLNPRMISINDMYKLIINPNDTYKLYNKFKLSTQKLTYNMKKPTYIHYPYVKITSIEKVDGLHDTYCLKSEKNETAVFNGINCLNCSEIMIYTDKDNTGVCNLSSICLPKFVKQSNNKVYYDYNELFEVVKIITKNLNKVIDNNVYPVKEGQDADYKNRPIAIGVQGLADVFFKFKIPFTSIKAKEINKKIFETIYYAALTSSNEISKKLGKTYQTFNTSMAAKGILQPDLWNVKPSDLWDWDILKHNIKQYGLYNSLLVALMPTASTSQIMGNYEMFEPITSNMFVRSTLSGTFQIINKYLIKDLIELNIWNDTIKQQIIADNGSVQNIKEIPDNIKEIYKTVWEMSQKELINMDRDRSAYVCHSSSSNRYVKNPTYNKLTSIHMYCWKQGLKTGSYYLRSSSDVQAIKYNIDANIVKLNNKNNEECLTCSS